MKIKILILLLIAMPFSKEALSQQRFPLVDVIAVITHRDSTKEITTLTRSIDKVIGWDSVAKKDIITVDTTWGRRYFLPVIDPKTKKQLVKNGQPQYDPTPRYNLVSKDSVRWKGIEGVSVELLLDKKTPPRGY